MCQFCCIVQTDANLC